MDRRFAAAMVLVGAIALAFWAWPSGELDGAATVALRIDGPDGALWNGTVTADPASAFHALLAAAEAGGFDVQWTGPSGSRFVESIDGVDSRNGGWCVQVNGADSPGSTDRFPVANGDAVRWYWTSSQCVRF